jgi:hypothetical protein
MLLTSASDKIQVVTSSANAVAVHASFVDLSGTTVTPGRTNTSIAAAATTDVVASPGASTTRRVKFLSVWNDHATAAQTITVRHTDGTTDADVWSGSVPAQSGVIFDEESGWKVLSAETPGDIQTFDAPGGNWVKPTNFKPSFVLVRLWGGGGGAGGGASLATAVVAKGGSGGGGAVCVTRIIDPSDLPDVAFVSIGYGGLGGLGGSAGGAGSTGLNGQNSFFRPSQRIALIAYGGRSGTGGQAGAASTSGGIGTGGHDTVGATSSVGFSVTAINGASTSVTGPNWEGGGAGGGSNNSATVPGVYAGGNTRWGGGGGGAGGCHTNVPAVVDASAGGGTGNSVGSTAGGLGAAAGTSGATPTAGANGTDTDGISGGHGGGGGGTTVTASTDGANGGNGGKGGGGGGGGGVGMNPGVGGAGGNGGNGYGIIITW